MKDTGSVIPYLIHYLNPNGIKQKEFNQLPF